MAQAKSGDTVRVHYTGRLEDGSVFDSSEGREPLEFVLGAQQVIPGFEAAVDGLSPGEERSVSIPADRAYGPRREEMVLTVGRDQFPDGIRPEVGQQLQMSQDGQAAVVTVTGVSDAEVTLDANHPLAGKDLLFDVQLVEIV
jgi:FKBP-type peptidyl-prolyl cis-trans isomerase 2